MTLLHASVGRLPRSVPWAHRKEWLHVYHLLFPCRTHSVEVSDAEIRKGLQVIQRWKRRGKLPIAVEATADLLALRSRRSAPTEGDQRRHAIAMVIIRLVNALVDQEQKYQFAQPVSLLAESLKLPRFMVDIRHAATHDTLPTLAVLEVALDEALAYLLQNYWQLHETLMESRLQACREALLAYKAQAKTQESIDQQLMLNVLKACSPVGTRDQHFGLSVFVQQLLEEGMLVALNKRKRCRSAGDPLPDRLQALWRPLLCFVARRWGEGIFWLDLVEAIMRKLNESLLGERPPSSSFSFTLAQWAAFALKEWLQQQSSTAKKTVEVEEEEVEEEEEEEERFEPQAMEGVEESAELELTEGNTITVEEEESLEESVQLLKWALRWPLNRFSRLILHPVLEALPPQWSHLRRQLQHLLDCHQPTISADLSDDAMKYDVNMDLRQRQNHFVLLQSNPLKTEASATAAAEAAAEADEQDPSQSLWKLASTSHWSQVCPIGTLPPLLCMERGLEGEVVQWTGSSRRFHPHQPLALSHGQGIYPDVPPHKVEC